MRLRIQSSVILLALAVSAGAAQARDGTTTTQLGLHAAPSANTELLLTMPAGSQVSVGGCARGWCKVVWNSYSGYASESGLAISAASRQAPVRGAMSDPGELWPIYPPYPYRAGYYPKADWYHDMPPYVALDPSFHRRRYFMMAQERNRYRYMPHIFHGYSDGDRIDDVDIQGISGKLKLKSTYGE
jgi:hypothetical protein